MPPTREEALAAGSRVELIVERTDEATISVTMVPAPDGEMNSLQQFAEAVMFEIVAEADALEAKGEVEVEAVLSHVPGRASDSVLLCDIQIEATISAGVNVRCTAVPPPEDWETEDPVVKACYEAWRQAQETINNILVAANEGKPPREADATVYTDTNLRERFLAGKEDLL